MSNRISQIGRCIGCDRLDRLDEGVCDACLTRRGRKWAEMSNRCRTDPEYAASVYERIQTDRGREMFLAAYGSSLLAGRGNSIGAVRQKDEPAGEWEAELTSPPPAPPDKGGAR